MLEILTLLISFIISILTGYYFKYICDSEFGSKLLSLRFEESGRSKKGIFSEIITPIFCTSILFFIIGLLVLMFQQHLPLNPNEHRNLNFSDALNLAISFITTTNLQITHMTDELSYLSKSVLSLITFIGSVIGISIAFILIRSFSSLKNTYSLGNFYNDALNVICLFYLPACFLLSIIFISNGVIQNFSQDISIITIDGFSQVIQQGPVASFLSIKVLGVNGGGFFASSSAHPFENPTELTNLLQVIAMLVIPSSIFVCYGLKCHSLKNSALYLGIFYCLILFSTNIVKEAEFESYSGLQGKEMRFDILGSAQYNTTSAISSGSSNSSISKYSPISKLVFTANILSGNLIFGGAGIGFTNFITIVILTVFIAGLMAGRAPVIYGKRIDINEITYIVSYLVVIQLSIFCSIILNIYYTDFHLEKFPELFFNHISATNNNGQSIQSNKSSIMIYTTSACMLLGRLAQLTTALGIAHSFSMKNKIQNKLYDINTNSIFFIILLFFIVLINLTIYLPFLLIWPVTSIINLP